MQEVGSSSSWQNHPIDQPKRIEILLEFAPDQYERLKQGLEPEQMEDKWLIYYGLN